MAFPHFAFEEFATDVSLKKHVLPVKYFYKNNYSARIALQMFRILKGMKTGVGTMTAVVLEEIIQKFEKQGSFDLQSNRGRKRLDLTVVEEVDTAVQKLSSSGVYPGIHKELPEHWTNFPAQCIKFYETHNAIFTKYAECLSYLLLTCQRERLFPLEFLARREGSEQ